MADRISLDLTLPEAQALRDELLALRGATCVALTRDQTAMTTRLLNTLIVRIAEQTGTVTVVDGLITVAEVEQVLTQEGRA